MKFTPVRFERDPITGVQYAQCLWTWGSDIKRLYPDFWNWGRDAGLENNSVARRVTWEIL